MEKSTHTREYALLRSHLRTLRENAGLTQRDLAKRLDVPHSWVAKIECGERRIDLVELCILLTACGNDASAACGQLAGQISQIQAKRHRKGKGVP
jgi:transcriptional regulator with XRE-family HTH domain